MVSAHRAVVIALSREYVSVMSRVPPWVLFLIVTAVLVGTGTVLALTPTSFVAVEQYRPTTLDGKIRIDGRPAPNLRGSVSFVGVAQRPVTLLEKWLIDRDPKVTVYRRESRLSSAKERRLDANAIAASKDVAAAVAYELLGETVRVTGSGARVDAVERDGPADGVVRSGDVITRVNDTRVQTASQIVELVGSMNAGERLVLRIRRGDRVISRVVTSESPPRTSRTQRAAGSGREPSRGGSSSRPRSRIGIAVTTADVSVKLPHKVAIRTRNVGGPSAGLPFMLAVYDSASKVDLLRGRRVVATGQLDIDGTVHAVGGIRQKAFSAQDVGADLFLVPEGNARAARRAVRELCQPPEDCVDVVAVTRAQDAVDALRRVPR